MPGETLSQRCDVCICKSDMMTDHVGAKLAVGPRLAAGRRLAAARRLERANKMRKQVLQRHRCPFCGRFASLSDCANCGWKEQKTTERDDEDETPTS